MTNLADLLNESLNAPLDPIAKFKGEVRAARDEAQRATRLRFLKDMMEGVPPSLVDSLAPHLHWIDPYRFRMEVPGHRPIEGLCWHKSNAHDWDIWRLRGECGFRVMRRCLWWERATDHCKNLVDALIAAEKK